MSVTIAVRYEYACDTQQEYDTLAAIVATRQPDTTEHDAPGLRIVTTHSLTREI